MDGWIFFPIHPFFPFFRHLSFYVTWLQFMSDFFDQLLTKSILYIFVAFNGELNHLLRYVLDEFFTY